MCYTNIQPKGESEPNILACGLQSSASRFQDNNLIPRFGHRIEGGRRY